MATKKDIAQLHVWIPTEQKEWLKRCSYAGRPQAEIVRRALDEYRERHPEFA